jgi:hypothetical protein
VPGRPLSAFLLASAFFLVTAPAASSSPTWPASYLSGPAGEKIILPPRAGVLLGLAVGAGHTFADGERQLRKRQAYIGRRLDIEHRFYGTCAFPARAVRIIASHGRIPMLSWSMSSRYSLTQIANGDADACIRRFGNGVAAWNRRLFLRIFWEFNGHWFAWSGTGNTFVSAWRRTVEVLQSAGVRKASFVWAPAEGQCCLAASYPGDAYVDWVASDGYNWNKKNAWCGSMDDPHPGWCQFAEIFHDFSGDNVEQLFGPRKPFMNAETGSREGFLGRKGRWFRKARDAIKARFKYLRAFVYTDINTTQREGCCNWRIDSSRSSLRGFRALARDSYFWTRRG